MTVMYSIRRTQKDFTCASVESWINGQTNAHIQTNMQRHTRDYCWTGKISGVLIYRNLVHIPWDSKHFPIQSGMKVIFHDDCEIQKAKFNFIIIITHRTHRKRAKYSICFHCIAQVTLNDRVEPRTDLFSKLIELYESWLAFESTALMCNDVQSWKICGDTFK